MQSSNGWWTLQSPEAQVCQNADVIFVFCTFSDQSPIIALPCHSVTESLLVLDFAEPVGFSKLLNGFVKIDTCIILSCCMDLSKLLHVFL